MTHHQPNPGNRNNRTHGRPTSRGAAPDQTPSPILERFTYDAYGQHRPAEGERPADAGEEIGEEFNPLFQGMAYDPAAKLFGCAPRAFDPTVARWAPSDPAGYMEGRDPYPGVI